MAYINHLGQALTYDYLEKLNPFDEVHPNLFQGGKPDENGYQGFDMVVSCEQWARRQPLVKLGGMFIHLPFADSDEEDAVPWGSVESAAEAIAHALSSGAKVLVHCTAGLNRSSLVVHQALRAVGLSAPDAVARIREKRSEWCLCNKTFERLCLEH